MTTKALTAAPAATKAAAPVDMDEMAANARQLAEYVTASEALAARAETAHAAAWGIKSALWVDGSGKTGNRYRPDVAAVLEAAYPMPADASAGARNRVQAARSKLYSIIDATTKTKLGTRADRRPDSGTDASKKKRRGPKKRKFEPTGTVPAAWNALATEYGNLSAMVAELTTHVTGNNRRQALDVLTRMQILVREHAALDALGRALDLGE